MSEKKRTQKLFCRCGCGTELIRDDSWRRYSRNVYITGHNVPIKNALSILDKTKDTRKNQTGFLAMKIVSNIRKDAIKAGYEWKLEPEFVYYKMIADCYYCGQKSGWPHGRNGLDRIDSSKGYLIENCVTSCRTCNSAKSNKDTDTFYAWVELAYKNLVKNGKIKNG